MTCPRRVEVCGRTFIITERDMPDAKGLCDSENGVITVAPGQVPYQEKDTVLHEVMHAILRQQGRQYTAAEERYVTALATGLLGVLRTNPELTTYLMN